MTFTEVQSYVASLIAADPVLSLLGTPIQVDDLADPETSKSAIANQLRTTGVCIEIGTPELDISETLLDGTTKADAACDVFFAEHPTVTHAPARAALLNRMVTALTKKPSTIGQKPARLQPGRVPRVMTEGGYILRMLTVFVPLNIKQP